MRNDPSAPSLGLLCLASALLFGAAVPEPASAQTWINVEYAQHDSTGRNRVATDFDLRVTGDLSGRILTDPPNAPINPFPSPKTEVTFDGVSSTVRFSSGIPPQDGGNIVDDPNAKKHFGIAVTGEAPKVFEKAWTYASNPFKITLPEVQTSFLFNPTTSQLLVTAQNLTTDTVTLSQAGHLLTSVAFTLQDLNGSTLPASFFVPLPALNGEYLPGQARTTTLSGVNPSDFITTYGSFIFSGASALNDYRLDGAEWLQASVSANVIPEPDTTALLGIGGISLIGLALRRRRMSERAMKDKPV